MSETNTSVYPTKEVVLPDSGLKAVIRKGKGRDTVNIQKMINGKTEFFIPAALHLLCEIDGEKKPMEFYMDELTMSDFSELSSAMSSVNFISDKTN